MAYQNSWQIRLMEEFKRSHIGVFFTLTYAPENVPEGNDGFLSVDKSDLYPMLKRFRMSLFRKTGKALKYFITSEYGPATLRPHYHGLFFGISVIDALPFLTEWKNTKGFVKYDLIQCSNLMDAQGVCRYVSKYCSKGDFENPHAIDGDVRSTFHLISKGLGLSYLTSLRLDYHLCKGERFPDLRSHAEEIVRRLNYPLNGFNYKLPRYYRDKILNPGSMLSYEVTQVLLEQSNALCDRELAEFQASHSADSHEAHRLMGVQEVDSQTLRENGAREKFSKFYSKSKI